MNYSESKFNGLSKIYSKYRPTYAEKAIEYIINFRDNEIGTVADIGAGTGKLSKLFLDRGFEVYSVDPNAEMLNQACIELRTYNKFHPILSKAENTTLKSYSIDLIVVGQAFHRFDVELFFLECKRIGKRDMNVAIMYNNGDKNSKIMEEIDILSKKYCPLYKGSSGGLSNNEIVFENFFSQYKKLIFPNDYSLLLDAFLGLNFSASYAPKDRDENYFLYKEKLEEIFYEYSDGKKILMKNNTILRIGKI